MVKILLDKNGKAILRNGAAISLNEPSPTPSIPTTLGSRIDDKATVVGVLQDHEGNDYVLAVVDAVYRSGSGMAWGSTIDTSLQNDYDTGSVEADHHTGKFNTDLILSTYDATDYPAFNFARNACTVTIGSNTYYSVLPNANELKLLYDNKDVLDQYDPTVITYSSRTMSEFNFGSYGAWSSSELLSSHAWCVGNNGSVGSCYKGTEDGCGVCPVICIPLI